MNYTAEQFIAMPDFLNLKRQNLKYLDALTYVAIRSCAKKDKDYSYPPYNKIMERSGLGRTFIASSINRLEAAGLFKIDRSKGEGTCNRYYFSKFDHFEQLSFDILYKTKDLNPHERSMLICLRQLFIHGGLSCFDSITKISERLGITYKMVHSQLTKLISKGYVREVCKLHRYSEKSSKYFKLTDKIHWPLPKNTVLANVQELPKIKVA